MRNRILRTLLVLAMAGLTVELGYLTWVRINAGTWNTTAILDVMIYVAIEAGVGLLVFFEWRKMGHAA